MKPQILNFYVSENSKKEEESSKRPPGEEEKELVKKSWVFPESQYKGPGIGESASPLFFGCEFVMFSEVSRFFGNLAQKRGFYLQKQLFSIRVF